MKCQGSENEKAYGLNATPNSGCPWSSFRQAVNEYFASPGVAILAAAPDCLMRLLRAPFFARGGMSSSSNNPFVSDGPLTNAFIKSQAIN